MVKLKLLFVGVFDRNHQSTNTSQIISFKRLGVDVVGYNYRSKSLSIGKHKRDLDLIRVVKQGNFDLIVFSKCNKVSEQVFVESKNYSKTCLWFMDPLVSYDEEMRSKTELVDYFCCDKINVLEVAKKHNSNSFHVCEGYNEDVDFPTVQDKRWDVSFIGNVYGDRESLIKKIESPVTVLNGAYGKQHSLAVCSTKINLNFCTSNGASDRVYKILAASGFLLSNDWSGRKKHFKDGEDLVIFTDIEDLNKKIKFYLNNKNERDRISSNGHKKVQKYTRLSWAKEIINLYEQVK